MLHRFYLPQSLKVKESILLPDNIYTHIRALRLRRGEAIELFNGDGYRYHALLNELKKDKAIAYLNEQVAGLPPPCCTLILLQAFSTPSKMDWVIQKAVEIGVTEIYPFIAERSNACFDSEKNEHRQTRWQNILIAACEQSGCDILPKLHPLMPWQAVLESVQASHKLLLEPTSTSSTAINSTSIRQIAVAIGPEGGFSHQERQLAIELSFCPYRLGPRMLRTETAAIAALVHLHTLYGDYMSKAVF